MGGFGEFGFQLLVVNFVAVSDVGLGVGEQFVRTHSAQIILADALKDKKSKKSIKRRGKIKEGNNDVSEDVFEYLGGYFNAKNFLVRLPAYQSSVIMQKQPSIIPIRDREPTLSSQRIPRFLSSGAKLRSRPINSSNMAAMTDAISKVSLPALHGGKSRFESKIKSQCLSSASRPS